MKIIFLDFDGVMDTVNYNHYLSQQRLPGDDEFGTIFDPNCIQNLKRIVDETGAEIVICSSWKYYMTYQDFLDMWSARGLPGFVRNVTPTSKESRKRGDEIDAWLNECHDECQYVIIDDFDSRHFNEHQLSHLLVVNQFNGLDEETTEKAIRMLNAE